MFTTDIIDATEAVRIGLAEYSVPVDGFDAEIDGPASRIAAQSGFSHRANKALLDATDGSPIDARLQWEVLEGTGRGPDHQERIAEFGSRRNPVLDLPAPTAAHGRDGACCHTREQ